MEKLTLENISTYFPFGLKIDAYYYDEEKPQNVIGFHKSRGVICSDGFISSYGSLIESDYALEHVKPILLPMDLTKSIIVEGKEIVPIVELAKISFPQYKYNWTLHPIHDTVFTTYNNYEFGFSEDSKCFWITYQERALNVNNQLDLFKQLYAWKIDVDNLIGRGLAIDCNTLEINPYN